MAQLPSSVSLQSLILMPSQMPLLLLPLLVTVPVPLASLPEILVGLPLDWVVPVGSAISVPCPSLLPIPSTISDYHQPVPFVYHRANTQVCHPSVCLFGLEAQNIVLSWQVCLNIIFFIGIVQLF